jgi:chromosome segregation ATPase
MCAAQWAIPETSVCLLCLGCVVSIQVASSKGKGSCASVSQGSLIVSDGAGDDGGALRERISDLENLLYQCMEAQTSAENKCEQLIAIKAEALDRAEAAVKEESELFSSLKMQLKLKTESIKHLTSKKAPSTAAPADPEANAVPPDPQRVSELEREVKELKSEIDALRMAANAPITDHPEYRELHTALSRADLAMRSEGHFIVQTSSLNQGLVKLFPNPDLEQRKHLNAMAAEVRNQFMQAIKDKKELCDELAVLRASGRDDRCGSLSSSASMGAVLSPGAQARVATMTTPVRKVFENTRLQMWREEQDFDARRRLLQEELDNTKREVMALQQQLESAHRKADLASMELEELKPSLRRLSGADLGDAASEIERIAKRAAEARMSCETEKQSRQAAEAALNTSEQLAAQLAAARSELEEAGKREAKLRHQLEAAEYAVAASERRANKQQRASLAADPGRLAQLQDENEQLQVKLARLQDEYESRKEEFAFLEGKVERNTKQFAELEAAGERVAEELGSCKALLAGEQARVKDLEVQLQQVASGDGAKEGLVLALKEAEKAVAELERRLEESQKNEEELRDGLAHQQAVHEALQKEASIAQEVLKETMKTLEGKNTMLEQLHADFNDKTTEAKELSDRVDALLADLDHTNRAMEDMRRRHEALIDDREGIEHSHQAQMDEMMCELKKRQERIDALEKEVEGASQRAKKAEHRLSDVEANVSDAAKVKSENKSLQATITQRDNELFEINFEVKGMQSKIKLLETERDELQASLGEVAHVRDEQQARGDKLQQQLAAAHADLETSQQEVGKLMGEHADEQGKAQQLAAKCSALEDEMRRLQLLATQATHRAEAAEAGKAAAGEEDSGKAAELAALQSQMEGWIDDMRALKEQEEAAREECVAAAKTLKEVREEKDKVEQALGEAQARVEELNAINTKLIGHSNAKQKVQHVVKMKEENNELHVSLKKAQSELSKVNWGVGGEEIMLQRPVCHRVRVAPWLVRACVLSLGQGRVYM